jgi:cold-inducible RNA-binding protein
MWCAFSKGAFVMSIKIYVGNLSFDSNESDLTGLFATYGEVESAKVITDQFTNRSRGFAFVEMSNREEGLKAIQALDSKDFGGRALKVNEARPKNDSGGGRRDTGRSRW